MLYTKYISLVKPKDGRRLTQNQSWGSINVIFDNTRSGNIRYFKEHFELTDNLSENFFAVKSNQEVIEYVSRNPDALGIISVNWISDKDDSLSMSFIDQIM
jgi:phosphate transport system substrate-binding protein